MECASEFWAVLEHSVPLSNQELSFCSRNLNVPRQWTSYFKRATCFWSLQYGVPVRRMSVVLAHRHWAIAVNQNGLTGASTSSQQQACFSSSLLSSAWRPGVWVMCVLSCCIKWLLLIPSAWWGSREWCITGCSCIPREECKVGLGWESLGTSVRP